MNLKTGNDIHVLLLRKVLLLLQVLVLILVYVLAVK